MLNKLLHASLGHALLKVCTTAINIEPNTQTQNFVLDCDDVPRVEQGSMPTERYHPVIDIQFPAVDAHMVDTVSRYTYSESQRLRSF